MDQSDSYIKVKVHLLRPEYKRAFVNRIEFCDASKNSGVVFYVRKGTLDINDYEKDFLDEAILNWIEQDYPGVRIVSQHVDCDIEIDEYVSFIKNLKKYSFPIQITYTSTSHNENTYKGLEIEIYCYENELRYPNIGISINAKEAKLFKEIESTYMKFSDYLELQKQ